MANIYEEFTIKKGKHYCSKLFRMRPYLNKDKLSYNVIFTEECKYTIPYPNNLAINKLFGLSYGYHHNNSARFGWHYNYDKIQLFAYCYVNGKRVEEYICALEISEVYHLSILKTGGSYFFAVSGKDILTQKSIKHSLNIPKYGYELFPYFGGVEVAPHNINIFMQKNK